MFCSEIIFQTATKMGDKCSKIEENNKIFVPANNNLERNNDIDCKNESLSEDEESCEASSQFPNIKRTPSSPIISDSENESEENQILVFRNDEDVSDLSDDDQKETVKSRLFNNAEIKLFKDQDIRRIREDAEAFHDPYFRPNVKVLSPTINTDLASSLVKSFACKNTFDLSELDSLIKWERCAVK